MLESSVKRLLDQLSPTDNVLDVGGWACPFNRAQWVLDAQPWQTRGFYRTFGGPPSQGGPTEWFTEQTWVQRDICSHEPWPFADRQFDFVVCSHTLEDLRDPLWVCHELIRVARAGYIEVPSRTMESILGVERPGQAGYSHHRWLIDIEGNRISFLQKYHMIHADWRFHLPASFVNTLPLEQRASSLWWRDGFTYVEREIHGLAAQEAELARFIRVVNPRPQWRYALNAARRRTKGWIRRVGGAVRRRLA